MTALPRLPRPAGAALAAAGLTTLEDVVAAGRTAVAELHGMGLRALAVLDEAVIAAGLAEREVVSAGRDA
jgi:hypothetical protein